MYKFYVKLEIIWKFMKIYNVFFKIINFISNVFSENDFDECLKYLKE